MTILVFVRFWFRGIFGLQKFVFKFRNGILSLSATYQQFANVLDDYFRIYNDAKCHKGKHFCGNIYVCINVLICY